MPAEVDLLAARIAHKARTVVLTATLRDLATSYATVAEGGSGRAA